MGWMETCTVDERMRFVMMVEAEEETFAALCRQFGVSRKTGYKWLARYETDGVTGLLDRSRAPHDHPQAIAAVGRRAKFELVAAALGQVHVAGFGRRLDPGQSFRGRHRSIQGSQVTPRRFGDAPVLPIVPHDVEA